jgi:hypothetical protein
VPRRQIRPPKNAGRELRHGGERQQADRGELRVAGRAVIHVGEQQDHRDRDPPHREQDRADILAPRQDRLAPAQHQRHHDVVRRHDGERHGLDDHHRGRGRKTADEGGEREQFRAGGERQREHEHVAVDAPRREGHQARDRNRNDEQVDQHEVEREQPGGAAHLRFAAVLHHGDVELARQQHDRHGGEQRHGDERAPHRLAGERGGGARVFHRPGEQVHRPVEHDEGDEHADGDEGDQLDQGFGRDREDQPVLMLGRIDVARAEQHREGRHRECDEQRDVAEHRLRHAGGHVEVGEDGAERGRHRLELERDVGDRSDDRDQRDGRGDALVLAVARRDEVGDRGDVLRLGEPHDPGDQRRGEPDHDDRADIDGKEVVAVARGEPDRAEERPGGAVDRERERIDDRARADAPACADPVAVAAQ